jgi:hypothetical protein
MFKTTPSATATPHPSTSSLAFGSLGLPPSPQGEGYNPLCGLIIICLHLSSFFCFSIEFFYSV